MSTEIQFVVEGLLKSQGYVLARICEPVDFSLRRLPEINGAAGAGFSFPGKAPPPAHGEPCNGGRNAAGERKDKSAAPFIDRNRLTSSATLNNISILPILQRLRALDAFGQQRTDIFAFVLRRQPDIRYFKENETVHLRI